MKTGSTNLATSKPLCDRLDIFTGIPFGAQAVHIMQFECGTTVTVSNLYVRAYYRAMRRSETTRLANSQRMEQRVAKSVGRTEGRAKCSVAAREEMSEQEAAI